MATRLHLAAVPDISPNGEVGNQPIRVVLADDDVMVRRSLRLLLDPEDDVQVVAEAADLRTVLAHVDHHAPHVLVLDLGLPNGSSIATIRRLCEQSPQTEIVVLTTEHSPAFAQQAIDAGAIGFALKDRAGSELLDAIRRAAQGEEYVSPGVAAALAGLRRSLNGDGLSPREIDVLRLIALGHTSAEIAAKLHLSRRTVETHRARIQHKLGVQTRAGLVQFAIHQHLLTL